MIKKIKSLFEHEGVIRYLCNTSWLLGEKILRMIVGLFVSVWVARFMGPEQFGLYSYAQSFVALFSIIATLGLNSIVVRELVKGNHDKDVLIGTSFVMMLVSAFFVIFLVYVATFFTSNDHYTNLLILIFSCSVIFQSFSVLDFYFQGKVLAKYVVYANIVSLLLSGLIKIGLILTEAPLVSFVLVSILESAVLAFGFLYFYRKNGQKFRFFKFDKKVAFLLLKDCYPLIIAGAINSIYMKIDQVMIKEILGSAQVGYYSAAIKLSEAWFSIGVIICNSLFPAIVNAKNVSSALYYKRLNRLFLFLVSCAYLFSLTIFYFSDNITLVLYGKDFIEASSVLTIHIFSSVFVYLGVSSGRWLIIENKTLLNLYRNIFGLVINIGLNFVLIPKYGIVGSAYASLVSYAFAFYIIDFFQDETRHIFYLKTRSIFLLKVRNESQY